jgi:hypothetical protein
MSDGAELGLLEVRLCLTSIGFVRTNVWLGMQRLAKLSPEQIPRGRSREMTGNLSYVSSCVPRLLTNAPARPAPSTCIFFPLSFVHGNVWGDGELKLPYPPTTTT